LAGGDEESVCNGELNKTFCNGELQDSVCNGELKEDSNKCRNGELMEDSNKSLIVASKELSAGMNEFVLENWSELSVGLNATKVESSLVWRGVSACVGVFSDVLQVWGGEPAVCNDNITISD